MFLYEPGSATIGGLLVVAMLNVAQPGDVPECRPAGGLTPMAGLAEASGVAVSQRTPGRLWTHNDSGEPVIFALSTSGTVMGRVQVTGARVQDWEAIAVGPCPGGSCIYIADIGDNDANRKQLTIYRFPEPAAADGTAAVKDEFRVTYPDGAHDAEALLIAPDGRLFIVTKGETGAVALYRVPGALRAGTVHQLERVGEPRAAGKAAVGERITDGSVSPDGQWVVLRGHDKLWFYRATELFAGSWKPAREVDLRPFREPQGEGVAIAPDGTVYLAGEGGGKKQPGTFATLACSGAR
jgi:hypothetical protein